MIPKIKKILYATDLSSGADHALGYALSIAMSSDAKISIINVNERMTHQKNIEMRSEDFATAKKKLTARIKANLLSYSKAEGGKGCVFSKCVENIYVTAGVPVDVIIEQAKEGDYDLIIMGTHGHGFLYSALIGSTAKRMISQSPIPVLVVRIPDKLN